MSLLKLSAVQSITERLWGVWEDFSQRLGFAACQFTFFSFGMATQNSLVGTWQVCLVMRLFPRGEEGFELLSKAEFTSQVLGGVSTMLISSLTAEGGFDARSERARRPLPFRCIPLGPASGQAGSWGSSPW